MTSSGWGSSPPKGRVLTNPLSYSEGLWYTTNPSSIGAPSFQPFIAITWRVGWVGPSANLLLSRPSAAVLAPRSAFASRSPLGDASSLATKLDEMSSEYFYLQQVHARDVQELGLREGVELTDMYMVKVPLAYLSQIEPSAAPEWIDALNLREQLTQSYHHDTGNMIPKKEGVIHTVAVFIEQLCSIMWDWFPHMIWSHVMAIMPLTEGGQVTLVAHGHKVTVPLKQPTRTPSMNSSSIPNNIHDNSFTGFVGGLVMDPPETDRIISPTLSSAGFLKSQPETNRIISPSFHNSWTNTSSFPDATFVIPDKKTSEPMQGPFYYADFGRLHSNNNSNRSTWTVSSGLDSVQDRVASLDLSRSKSSSSSEAYIYPDTDTAVSFLKPDPNSVVAPLLAMGFSPRQCEAAVLAIKNATTPPLAPKLIETANPPKLHLDSNTVDDSSRRNRSSSPIGDGTLHNNEPVVPVQKNIMTHVLDNNLPSDSNPTTAGQTIKMVKVLDIPSDMNAFIFHCNANTRDECLERKMFGCPSGGQYGPHSKAKAGDLLFLADFSSWTVTGIFTAKCDAGLNLDRSAWGGKFPWQIRIHDFNTLRTVHIDKVNEILGLASGSKLNMLSKEQLVKLVQSKEFGPCVPSTLFKMKPASLETMSFAHALMPQSKEERPLSPENIILTESSTKVSPNEDRLVRPTSAPSSLGLGSISNLSVNRTKQVQTMNSYDEHPSTAMHRYKIVTAWFDVFAGEIVTLNELYNLRRSPQKKDTKKEKNISDELSRTLKSDCVEPWPTLTFTQVRESLENILFRWLQYAHAVGNEEGRNARLLNGGAMDDSGSWLRQGRSSSSHGKKREDPLLLTLVPGALEYVKKLVVDTGADGLSPPTDDIAEAIATKFLHDVEQFSADVRKTQVSSIRVGGDNYLKSIEDKALSIRLSEVTSKYMDANGSSHESTVMKVEWYTKASLTQGRPPQVQELDKECFDMLEKTYRDVSSSVDPDKTHFLTRLFVMLCRYDLFGDLVKTSKLPISSDAFVKMSDDFGVTHECFASPLTRICASYNSIFPDSDRYFGSLGSFFDFMPTEGSFFVNPPFGLNMKMTLEHILTVLQSSDSDKNALSFLVIFPKSRDLVSFLESAHVLPFLKRKNMMSTTNMDIFFIWLQNDFGYDLWTPTDSKVQGFLSTFLK